MIRYPEFHRISYHFQVAMNANRGSVRRWDRNVPSVAHSLWCATTILCEKNLKYGFRHNASIALLYHDVKEDTKNELPVLPSEVLGLINGMTFEGGFKEERIELWGRPNEVILLKLYDKVSNLMDGHWMDEEKERVYLEHTTNILVHVEKNFPPLMICDIARVVINAKVGDA